MDFLSILGLIGVALIPVAFATLIHVLKIYTKFDELKKHIQYAIIIALFSISCILGTICGVPSSQGAIINVRDASPIIAGLMFGGPIGVVVGFIGGLYRFIAVYFEGPLNAGAFTQVACAVSTFMAGVFTLLVRRFIFGNHHGKWYYGFFLGILCEDFHMLLVILTHLGDDIEAAYGVVTDVAAAMLLTNAFSVMIAILIADALYKEKFFDGKRPYKISTKIQLTLIGCLTIAYGAVSSSSYFATKRVSLKTNEALLSTNVDDLRDNVNSLVEDELLRISKQIKQNIQDQLSSSPDLNVLLLNNLSGSDYEISEAHLIGSDNVIKYSSHPSEQDGRIGFDMSSTEQSKKFECLLGNAEYYNQEYMKPGSDNVREDNMKYFGVKLDSNSYDLSYLQIGLNSITYHQLLDKKLVNSASFKHIGNKGYMIVAKGDGEIVSKLADKNTDVVIDKTDVVKIIDNLADKQKYDKDAENIYKYEKTSSYFYYTYARDIEGYYVVALADVAESDLSANIAFTTITLSEVFAFLVLYCVLYIVIKRSIVDKIEEVGGTLSKITKGNLNVKVHVNNSRELKELSQDINATVTSLKKYAEKEQAKIAEELQFAKNIQHSALPTVFPLNNNFRIFANMVTAKAVGGDFYDFYYINQNTLAILIADVSGKGIPAAMFMMKSKTIIKGLVESGIPIHLAATEANKKLCEGNDANMFVTGWLGVINIKTGHVDFVNAGHNPPLIQKEDGTFEYLNSKKGFVFAGIDGFNYEKQSFDLKKGEKIYLYTDGVTEATNKEKELYGEARLLKACNELGNKMPKEMCNGILESVNKFAKGAEQADDITMLCFQLTDQEIENSHVFEAKVENTETVTEYVGKYLHDAGCNPKAEMQINVAIDEIFSNICHYAYKENQEGNVRVSVSFDPSKKNVSISFEDRGVPYNPLEKEDPNVEASIEDRQIGGLGIFIVKKTMDDVVYENDNGHNILTITKNIK